MASPRVDRLAGLTARERVISRAPHWVAGVKRTKRQNLNRQGAEIAKKSSEISSLLGVLGALAVSSPV
jgi:hypothetical protein